jgi:hypothetical protein
MKKLVAELCLPVYSLRITCIHNAALLNLDVFEPEFVFHVNYDTSLSSSISRAHDYKTHETLEVLSAQFQQVFLINLFLK